MRAMELSREIKRRELHIHYSIYSRADTLSASVVEELSSSGLYCVFLGVESFSQAVLNRYGKGLTTEKNIEAITLLKKYNIHIRLGTILFDSGTTMAELGESISALQIISSTKPELLFQPMFFSNVLIPLTDTPSESYIRVSPSLMPYSKSNVALHENWLRRSRNEDTVYEFSNPQVDLVYSCLEELSEQLTQKCIKEENRFYTQGYTKNSMQWFSKITSFTISQLSYIFDNISAGYPPEECNKAVSQNINQFCLDITCQ